MPVDYQALIDQFVAQQKKANEANETRYQQLLTTIDALGEQVGAQGTYGEAMNLIDQIGASARTEIQDQAARAQASGAQDLVSRGLGNTTIRSAMQRGIMADTQRALGAQAEREAGQKAGLLTQRAGAELDVGRLKAGAIEGKYDTAPDLGMMASLLQAAAAADEATPDGRRTVTSTAGSHSGPGAVTRWQAEQAANDMAARAKSGQTAPAKSDQTAPAKSGQTAPQAANDMAARGGGGFDPQTGMATGFTGPGSTVYLGEKGYVAPGGTTQLGGEAAAMAPGTGYVKGPEGGVSAVNEAGETVTASPEQVGAIEQLGGEGGIVQTPSGGTAQVSAPTGGGGNYYSSYDEYVKDRKSKGMPTISATYFQLVYGGNLKRLGKKVG